MSPRAGAPGAGGPGAGGSAAAGGGAAAVALVALGGAAGAAARDALTSAVPTWRGVSVATVGIDVAGAFALGVLVEALTRAGAPLRSRLRLLLGTGFLGAFTTYSALVVDAELLVLDGAPALALATVGATVLGGLVASGAGAALGAAVARRPAAGRGRPGGPG